MAHHSCRIYINSRLNRLSRLSEADIRALDRHTHFRGCKIFRRLHRKYRNRTSLHTRTTNFSVCFSKCMFRRKPFSCPLLDSEVHCEIFWLSPGSPEILFFSEELRTCPQSSHGARGRGIWGYYRALYFNAEVSRKSWIILTTPRHLFIRLHDAVLMQVVRYV
jgi:hypothetical protein